MAEVKTISVYGSRVLRQEAQPVDKNYEGLETLIEDMFVTMREAEGVGLAAPQVGLSLRLFVLDASPFAEHDPALKDFRRVVLNPEIVEYLGEPISMSEGCLSVPGIQENVERPEGVRVRYQDASFAMVEEDLHGMPARIFQHEYDHLQGRVFVDHLNPMRRRLLHGKLKRMARGTFKASYACQVQ